MIAALVVLLFVITLLTGGGGHGPVRHGGGDGGAPASTVAGAPAPGRRPHTLMTLSTRHRKLSFTAHVSFPVGWLVL